MRAERQVHRVHKPRRRRPGKSPKHPPVNEAERSVRDQRHLDEAMTIQWRDGTATRVGLAKETWA